MTGDVKIFANTVEQEAFDQIERLAAHPVSNGSKIRIMPDVHAGAGCTIGTTMTIKDTVCPNLVGVDIGCGMLAVKLGVKRVDFDQLDKIIKWEVPSGFNVHNRPVTMFDLKDLRCPVSQEARANCSIGTLGGGNHFIEVDRQDDGTLWLVIHSGSRHLGLEVARWYQELADNDRSKPGSDEIAELIRSYKETGRQQEIAAAITELKKSREATCGAKDLAYLTGDHLKDYLHDMAIIQKYAETNRQTIADIILRGLKTAYVEKFSTIHNYIDLENMILRKGAVSAQKGERLIIPMNMRDGSLICIGKGNDDWNFSAPHGAGRLMSRAKARNTVSLGDYKETMKNVHSSCVNFDTIDEAPMAYKSMKEIMECIRPTCDVQEIVKPVYNFKASN